MKNKVLKTLLTAALLTTSLTQPAHANEPAKGLAIWDQLQGSNPKGYVLLMRHALAPGVGDPPNLKVGDCSTQRNLNEEGRTQAREMGQWLQRREIKILRVESSRWCRAKETAKLLNLGKVRPNKYLDSLFQETNLNSHPHTANIKKRIINHRNTRGLLVFVGHFVNFQAVAQTSLDSGEGVLVRATSTGEIKILGYTPKP
jgi:phosphohistidine phosphatase SixA